MKYIYPKLELEIYTNNIKLKDMANQIGISTRALTNKLKGSTAFTWPEACLIQKNFFPYMSKDILFLSKDEINQKGA